MTVLTISITGGTATVVIEYSEDESLFIPVATITATSGVQFAIPASVLAINVSAISGATVTATYRTIVLDNMPAQTLIIYGANSVVSPVIVSQQSAPSGARKLAQTTLTSSAAIVYTTPTNTRTKIVHMRAVNFDASARTLTMWHDGSADANIILPPVSILAGGFGEFDGIIYLEAGDTLYAKASANTAITLTVYGEELL
jgi:CBS-domain-containing membrane protein